MVIRVDGRRRSARAKLKPAGFELLLGLPESGRIVNIDPDPVLNVEGARFAPTRQHVHRTGDAVVTLGLADLQ